MIDRLTPYGNRAVTRFLAETRVEPAVARQGTNTASESPAVAVTEQDRSDFAALPGNIRNARSQRLATVEDYVRYRNRFFGSAAAYETARQTADAEFDGMTRNERRRVGQTESETAKRILYRWVRKAYVDAGVADPVEIIRSGMTPELRQAFAAVKASHPGLTGGGFVARPKKKKGYRLGTISKHGTGQAVDIRHGQNLHLTRREWRFITGLAGVTADRSVATWRRDPGAVWQAIHDVNAAYVAALQRRVAQIDQNREQRLTASGRSSSSAAVAAGAMAAATPAHQIALRGYPALIRAVDRNGIDKGFFDLERDLVVDLARQGLTWGATFSSSVDLHHFEL